MVGGILYHTPGWVGNTNGGTLRERIHSASNPMTKITMGSEIAPIYLDITHDDRKTYPRFGSTHSGIGKESTFEFPNQKVSLVHAFNRNTQPGFEGIDAVVFGFSDKKVDLRHALMTNMINSIPAEMYNRGMSNFKPQIEPTHA